MFHKCSDLIFGDVLGILCACGPDVRAVQGRAEHDNQAAIVFSGTNRYNAIQPDRFLCGPYFFCVYLMIKGFLQLLSVAKIQSRACFRKYFDEHLEKNSIQILSTKE